MHPSWFPASGFGWETAPLGQIRTGTPTSTGLRLSERELLNARLQAIDLPSVTGGQWLVLNLGGIDGDAHLAAASDGAEGLPPVLSGFMLCCRVG